MFWRLEVPYLGGGLRRSRGRTEGAGHPSGRWRPAPGGGPAGFQQDALSGRSGHSVPRGLCYPSHPPWQGWSWPRGEWPAGGSHPCLPPRGAATFVPPSPVAQATWPRESWAVLATQAGVGWVRTGLARFWPRRDGIPQGPGGGRGRGLMSPRDGSLPPLCPRGGDTEPREGGTNLASPPWVRVHL